MADGTYLANLEASLEVDTFLKKLAKTFAGKERTADDQNIDGETYRVLLEKLGPRELSQLADSD